MFLLQTSPQIIQNGTNQLLQYGVLGFFAVIMITVIWYLEKQRTKRDDENKIEKEKLIQRLSVLETKIEDMQGDLISKMESIIVENSKALNMNMEVMREVKQLLIKKD